MVIILICRYVRLDREREFLKQYEAERPAHPDFICETLTKVNDSLELPEPLRSLTLARENCFTYLNLAYWKSAESFNAAFNPKTFHDPEIEEFDRVRAVLEIKQTTCPIESRPLDAGL
jgi:hypothetical protein